jgi:alcohol dehydrogenase
MSLPDADALRATWSFPTQVRFGPGRIAELGAACRSVGMSRPLLVTDRALAAHELIATARAAIEGEGLAAPVFADVKPNPTDVNVVAGVEVLRAGGHDGVVAIGGGSAMDAAKAIAFMVAQSRPLADFEDHGDNWRRAEAAGILPVIAVPTTAGTGSEVGRAAVVTDTGAGVKRIVFHPRMLPVVVISDPELTVGLPPAITAATGMDALAHALEAYCAPGFHPMADGIAVEATRLVKEALPRAVADGTDLPARAAMLAAASMGAVAFQKGLGAIHALSHPIGARYDTHHGLTNAVVMPYVLTFNRSAVAGRLDRLAAYLGIEGGCEGLSAWVLDLRRTIGIPHALAELDLPSDDFDALVEAALADPTAAGSPVPLTAAGVRDLLERAWTGRLD